MDPNDNDLGIGELDNIDLFNDVGDDNWGGTGGQPGSPDPGRNDVSRTNSPSGQNKQSGSDQFRYGQEEPDERIGEF